MPETEVGCDGIKVVLQTIGTENGQTAICKSGFEFMQHRVGHRLAAFADLDDGNDLGFGFCSCPYPHFCSAALYIPPQLIQLDMVKEQVAKEMVMKFAPMLTTAS